MRQTQRQMEQRTDNRGRPRRHDTCSHQRRARRTDGVISLFLFLYYSLRLFFDFSLLSISHLAHPSHLEGVLIVQTSVPKVHLELPLFIVIYCLFFIIKTHLLTFFYRQICLQIASSCAIRAYGLSVCKSPHLALCSLHLSAVWLSGRVCIICILSTRLYNARKCLDCQVGKLGRQWSLPLDRLWQTDCMFLCLASLSVFCFLFFVLTCLQAKVDSSMPP